MEKAIEILATRIKFFENEYEKASEEYRLALKFAKKSQEIKEAKMNREIAWVRYVTIGNVHEEIVKASERVGA